jgi:hypothetical protein
MLIGELELDGVDRGEGESPTVEVVTVWISRAESAFAATSIPYDVMSSDR